MLPPLYCLNLKKKHGAEVAKQIIQFRLSHLDELISVVEEEGLTEESQCRKVDTYNVFFDKDMFEGAWYYGCEELQILIDMVMRSPGMHLVKINVILRALFLFYMTS
ncbi:uncharacterized protein ARMOST_20002 [Armillaria ostoyae]|uniref:Uncharacterized protein n=1 Tax=Armillaria ostoyae TaxID=47428 RepID=A0A284S686_ARMOS|nr:uncharacterized protein ARMOST_20002 [Armillaria ostoyae]